MGDTVSADLALDQAHWFDAKGRVVKATAAA
jgi:hypothetical protein